MKRLLFFFFFVLFSLGCSAKEQALVKVLYFHGQMRCKTCMAIESETKKLLDEALQLRCRSCSYLGFWHLALGR